MSNDNPHAVKITEATQYIVLGTQALSVIDNVGFFAPSEYIGHIFLWFEPYIWFIYIIFDLIKWYCRILYGNVLYIIWGSSNYSPQGLRPAGFPGFLYP